MNTIIPPNINDKFTTLYAYIKDLYRAFMSFTTNFFIDASSNITISGTSLTSQSQTDTTLQTNNTMNLNATIINIETANTQITSDETSVTIDSPNINITSTNDVSGNCNIQANTIQLTSLSKQYLLNTVNDGINTNMISVNCGSGIPVLTNINVGSLYIDYYNGNLWIYRSNQTWHQL